MARVHEADPGLIARLSAAAGVSILMLILAVPAAIADDADAFLAMHEQSWRQPSFAPPMRLGFPADRWREPGHSGRPTHDPRRCQRWRTTLAALGETFAGFTLRTAIADRYCALTGNAVLTSRWDWPWRHFDAGLAMPPRTLRRYGAWTVRCGKGPARARCALVQALNTKGASTHFVIDRVGGREMLLWRIYLPRPAAHPRASRLVDNLSKMTRAAGPRARPTSRGTSLAGTVKIALKDRAVVRRFTVCGRHGCMLEISGLDAGAGATRLASGLAVPASALLGANADRQNAFIRAGGFRAALAELARLRRAERHVSDD